MRATKKVPPLARASHWHAIWQAFVCPATNPVHMLVRWRVRSSGEHGWVDGWVGARARAARLPVGVAGGEGRRRRKRERREEEEEEEERRKRGRGRGEVSPEKPAAGEL